MKTRRLAIVADSHFDAASRFEECVRVHDWIADDIAARGVDLVLHSGDIYERRSTPEERRAVAAWVQRITERAPLIIVRGNHDQPGDLPLLERLETKHELRVVEGAEVLWGSAFGGFVVGCLAWPTKASVLALGATSHAEGELVAGDALRNVLRGLGQDMASASEGEPKVLLAHAMVRGSVTSTGQPLVGCDLEVGIEDIELAGANFYALGHIHKGQAWDDDGLGSGAQKVYPGSPRRTAFGETEDKGYVIAEFRGAACVSWELVKTPCAPMLLLEDEWGVDEAGKPGWLVGMHGHPGSDALDGAVIRFRFAVPADRRDEAREAAGRVAEDLLARGAIEVKVDPVVKPVNAARAPEVARAQTITDKLRALWVARANTPPEHRLQSLLEKAQTLEEADRAV